jgi:hypothetical protein
VNEMAEGIVVEDAPVFKTRDEIMKNQVGYISYQNNASSSCLALPSFMNTNLEKLRLLKAIRQVSSL